MAKQTETVTQFYERFIQRTAVAMLMMAFIYTISAFALVGGPSVAAIVDFLDRPLGIVIIIIMLPVFAKMVWLRIRQKNKCREADSFVAVTFKDAASRAFSVTFLTLILLLALSEGPLSDFPAAFFINIITAVSLATCSGWFLYANRDIEEDDDFGDADDHEDHAGNEERGA